MTITNENIHNATDLNELLEMLNNATSEEMERIDLTSLPTFGRMDIDEFEENVCATSYPVWSWDDTHAIVGEGNWEIVRHAELRDEEEV